MKKENLVNIETNFLELNIQLSNRLFHTKLYDKRDDFGFHISRLPFKDSNIPHRMFYSSASAEVLRICRATSSLDDVISSSKSLVQRMLKQGANEHSLKKSLIKSLNKHQITVTKFNISTEAVINRFF